MHETYEIEHEFKARRAQGGLGLLSHTISVQNPQESIPLIPREEREEEKKGEGGGGRPGGGAGLAAWEKGEGEGVRGYLTPTTLNPKD